jgi:predicted hotdog family 3-hydroxylacyl-ACP dehydratase
VLIGREELCALIPHGGRMCLLDGVVDWNAEEVQCTSRSHLRPDHPLRSRGGLSVVHALEYGAQAMAVHGGLLARASGCGQRPGWLAAIRDAQFGALQWLDLVGTPLWVRATRIGGGEGDVVYRFEVEADTQRIVTARAMVMATREPT